MQRNSNFAKNVGPKFRDGQVFSQSERERIQEVLHPQNSGQNSENGRNDRAEMWKHIQE
jgi:hypothetical protein